MLGALADSGSPARNPLKSCIMEYSRFTLDPMAENVRKHEVAFCAEVSKWADRLFEARSELPFGSSDIESFGRGTHKRQDFRVYGRSEGGRGPLVLCGEVKLPGNPQGRSPFDPIVMLDAFNKATAENCRYFFTWNVEHLALFDRSLWDRETMHERCIGEWKLGLSLDSSRDVARPEVEAKIRDEFLPRFFADFAEIKLGRRASFTELPSDLYISILESHLAGPMGPVRQTRDFLALSADASTTFDARLRHWMAAEQQWNFDRTDPESWRETVDRAARSMVYVLSNRILFYQAVRLRYSLPELKFPRAAKTPERALNYLRKRFQDAVDMTGDYEPVFFPEEKEWAALMALSGTDAVESWDKVITAIDRFNFKEIPTDILGHTFQKLISPEERHKFGQHYTSEDIVDVINAFCIRKPRANVLDPACGSGSFLVRAWYRKYFLDKTLENHELLEGLYGCDVNAFPAHLTTLNLAARNITNQENYPRVVRKNFFAVDPQKPFCEIPDVYRDHRGRRRRKEILLPELDAVVGNPPYVRYQDIPKAADKGVLPTETKEHYREVAERDWPGLKLSGQSDLHVYFWPGATRYLSEGAWFGFLTSSSWLDARYGFPLQRWALLNFRIRAIIESVDEPWFEDARIKTAVIIMQRCGDETLRDKNTVHFVRLLCPLAEILGRRDDEGQRQQAAEHLRDLILRAKTDVRNDQFRILCRKQSELWSEGQSVAQTFAKQRELSAIVREQADDGSTDASDDLEREEELRQGHERLIAADYGGGKWGRYLRAPEFYFDVMRKYADKFVRIGDIAAIKYGILSGCDGFFMPKNVSARILHEHESEIAWQALPLMVRVKRKDVENGKIVIVECGDGTLHPIEADFVKPEIHSLMQVDRPIVTPEQLEKVVLWVDQPLSKLKGTLVHRYITWGSKQTFQSKKSKSVPIPERPGCAGRSPWYDLTGLRPGVGFWPMAQQYRHIIPANPSSLACNHNLFDIHSLMGDTLATKALMPILNSSLVALIKTFYGRYAGTEGNLKTEIVDVVMIEVPDPRKVTKNILRRLEDAFERMQARRVTHLVEQQLLDCHTADEVREAARMPLHLPAELEQGDRRQLDDAVFELLGVVDGDERSALIDRLYRELAIHFRAVRIVEVQKMEQRRQGGASRDVSAQDLAKDAWNELEDDLRISLASWLAEYPARAEAIDIPDGAARLPDASHFFEANTVFFGSKPAVSIGCDSREQAELIYAVAAAGLRGAVLVPVAPDACHELASELSARLSTIKERLQTLAESRAGSDRMRAQVFDLMYRWFVHGKRSDLGPSVQ